MSEKITEKIEFLTQIHTAWNKTEQRVALRSEPRRYISYDYIGIETWQSQYLRSLTYSQQTQLIQFPLWHATSILETMHYAGQTNIQVNPKNLWSYRNVGGIMLWQDDDLGGEQFGIRYITANGVVGLTKQLTSDWLQGSAKVIPVIWGVLQQEDKYTNGNSNLSSMILNVELIANQQAPEFPASFSEFNDEVIEGFYNKNLPKKYLDVEIYMVPPPWVKDIDANYSRNANRLDNKSGIFKYDLKSIDVAETRQIEYLGISRAEVNNLQRFFYRCKGRQKSFFAPTWLNDIELAENAPNGQIYIIAKWSMYWKYYSKSNRRKTIIVFYVDGTSEILKIAGYTTTADGNNGKIYLDQPLSKPLLKDKVAMISFLCRYRHDSDTMIVDYSTVRSASTNYTFVEVSE